MKFIKKIQYFFLAVLFLSLINTSCKSTKDTTIKTTAQEKNSAYTPLENSLLWKIEGNGLDKPSYLYGTIHIINSDDYYLPKGTLGAMEASDKMVFEIDMNEMNDMGALMGIMDKAFMNDGSTLKDLVSDEDYKLIEDHFAEIGLPLMMLERLKPMFLTVFAYGDMDPNGLQSGSMKSYEMEFMNMANDAGKPIGGLETIEFQMGVFDSIPYKAQADMLVETIKTGKGDSDEFDIMIQMYKDQNINGMVTMIGDEGKEISNFEDILLHKRNKEWINGMRTMMTESPTFFAVGAGHLAGELGVIHLLRKEGYRLTPISQKEQ